jgi:hypothetical protein
MEPRDNTNSQDREATALRRTQELSRYDDIDVFGLEGIRKPLQRNTYSTHRL